MGLFGTLFKRLGIGGGSTPAPAPTPAPAAGPSLWMQKRTQDIKDIDVPEEGRYMEWQPVTSSLVVALRYNPVARLAQAQFNNGKTYTFGGMSFKTFKQWLDSSSKGKFFNDHLKGRYTQWQDAPATGQGILTTKLKALGFSGDQGKQVAAHAGWAAEAAAQHR